jgi:serine/threonine-protein kinase
MAIAFDLERQEVRNTPVPIQDGLRYTIADFSFSSLGWLVYVPRGEVGADLRRLVWVDRRGLAQALAAAPRNYQFPRLSPDGQKIAVQIQTVKSDIWVYDLTRSALSRLTSEGSNGWPIWTPDGKHVTFASNKGGHENLFWKLADGSGTEERLTTSEHRQNPRSWSPDGRELVFDDTDTKTGEDIWVLPLQGDRNPRPFLRTPFSEGWAALSPDGHWLAYVSKELARSEIYVMAFPNAGGRWQISTEGGTEPLWARNGRELFYRSGEKMMAVDIGTQPTFAARKPRLLFESAAYERVSTTPNYDVSLDGQRFLMVEASEQQSAPQINVVLNWFDELKQKVPTGKK